MPAEIISHVSSLTTDENDKRDFLISFICGLKRFIFEPVSYATYRDDQIFVTKLLTNVAQMHIHDALFAEIFTAPNFFEQLLAGKHAAAILHQRLQEIEFDRGQLDRFLVHADRARAEVH